MTVIKVVLLFFGLAISLESSSQDMIYLLTKADSFRIKGDIKSAIVATEETMHKSVAGPIETYNLASLLAMDKQIDSAFKYLLASIKASPESNILVDPDFIYLHNDARWNIVQDIIIDSNHLRIQNMRFAKKLWELRALDQAYIYQLNLVLDSQGDSSPLYYALQDLRIRVNQEITQKLSKYITFRGWPKISSVGELAAEGAFLIVQHGTGREQELVLNKINRLCKKGEAFWRDYALLLDRIRVNHGQKQLYGTQVKFNSTIMAYELYPVENEIDVDKRRMAIGLTPLRNYLKGFNIKY